MADAVLRREVPRVVLVVIAHPQPDQAAASLRARMPGETIEVWRDVADQEAVVARLQQTDRIFVFVPSGDMPLLELVRKCGKLAAHRMRFWQVDTPLPQISRGVRELFKHHESLSIAAFEQLHFDFFPMPQDQQHIRGPFDLIGDVHGCFDELHLLLQKLDYAVSGDRAAGFQIVPPRGRRLIFLGDLCDRGPDSPAVFRLVMDAMAQGHALCVMGNHDFKLLHHLQGKRVKMSHGFAATLEQLDRESSAFKQELRTWLEALPTHLVLDDDRLVVSHAGLPQWMHYRVGGKVNSHALYGQTTKEKDARGFPIRIDWAQDYRGDAVVVYGHTPITQAKWVNNTICLDTGCVFGGHMTALRYPERELVRQTALRCYYRVPDIAAD